MKTIKWVAGILSAGVLGLAVLQRQTASGLNHLNAKLRAELAVPVEMSTVSPAEQQETTRLQDENRELLKLRNEVRQLREQAKDLSNVRAENRRLRQAASGKPLSNGTMPAPAGSISREALANVGTSTPEAAVQTFLWAMREGNMEKFLQTVSPLFLERNAGNLNEAQKREFISMVQAQMQEQMKTFSDFRVLGVEQHPGKIIVQLQSSSSSSVARMTLRPYGNEWRVEDPF